MRDEEYLEFLDRLGMEIDAFDEKEADEKEAYRARVWKTRQRKVRDPKKKRKQKRYRLRNRAKLKQQAKRRYKKYKVNPAYKRQRKIQKRQKAKRRRLASEFASEYSLLRLKVAMTYLKKKSSKNQRVQVRDLPNSIQKLFKRIGVRPQDIEVRPSETYNLGMASSYGDGYRGFGYAVNIASGEHKEWSSGWGTIIPNQKPMPIPTNGAVIIGQEGGRSQRKRISYMLINPQNMGMVLPSEEIKLSREEDKALAIINEYNSKGRKQAFPEYGLGEYSIRNQYVQRLIEKGLLVKKGSGVRASTAGKNMARKVSDFYGDIIF